MSKESRFISNVNMLKIILKIKFDLVLKDTLST